MEGRTKQNVRRSKILRNGFEVTERMNGSGSRDARRTEALQIMEKQQVMWAEVAFGYIARREQESGRFREHIAIYGSFKRLEGRVRLDGDKEEEPCHAIYGTMLAERKCRERSKERICELSPWLCQVLIGPSANHTDSMVIIDVLW